MPKVNFYSELNPPFKILQKKILKDWIITAANEHGYSVSEINIIFCDDEKILEVNNQYLNHNYYTDIITFDLSDEQKTIQADLYISLDTVYSNSIKLKNAFEKELLRVVIHGVLHLLGYKDKKKEEIKTIRETEDAYLAKLFHVKQFGFFRYVSRETN
ncbi:MAG: rRNA maturation RNase YbeY [Bacteroidetes bacterium]|nr:rRNA maturation RNase YbeY [Bacteroidota bacterium]